MSLVISNIVNVKNLKELETKVSKIVGKKTEKKIKDSIAKKVGSGKSDSLIDKLIKKGKEVVENSKGDLSDSIKKAVNDAATKVVGKDKAKNITKAIDKGIDKAIDKVGKKGAELLDSKAAAAKETLSKYGLSSEEMKKILDDCLPKSPEAPNLSYLDKFTKLKPSKMKDRMKDCILASAFKHPNDKDLINKIADMIRNGSITAKDLITTKSSNNGCDWNIKLPDLGGLVGNIKFDADMKDFLSGFSLSGGSGDLLGGLKDAINSIGSKLSDISIPNLDLPGLDFGDMLDIDLPDIDIPDLFKDIDINLPDFLSKIGTDIGDLFSNINFDLGDMFKGTGDSSFDTDIFSGFNVNLKDFLDAADVNIHDIFKNVKLDLPNLFKNVDFDIKDLFKGKKIDFHKLFSGLDIDLPSLFKGINIDIGDVLKNLHFSLPDDAENYNGKGMDLSELIKNLNTDFHDLFKGTKVDISKIFKGLNIDIPNIFGGGGGGFDLPDFNFPKIDLPDIDFNDLSGLFSTISGSIKNLVDCKKVEPVKAARVLNDNSQGSIAIKNKIKETANTLGGSVFKTDSKTVRTAGMGTLKRAFSVAKDLTKDPYSDQGVIELANELSKNKVITINNSNELDKTGISSYDEITLLNDIVRNTTRYTSSMVNKNRKTIEAVNILA